MLGLYSLVYSHHYHLAGSYTVTRAGHAGEVSQKPGDEPVP